MDTGLVVFVLALCGAAVSVVMAVSAIVRTRSLKSKPRLAVMEPPCRSKGLVDLTDWERGFITKSKGRCPDCETGRLLSGPKGGCCVNMLCSFCGAKFSLAFIPTGLGPCQRIGEPTKKEEA
jgi:hypothetical protein